MDQLVGVVVVIRGVETELSLKVKNLCTRDRSIVMDNTGLLVEFTMGGQEEGRFGRIESDHH